MRDSDRDDMSDTEEEQAPRHLTAEEILSTEDQVDSRDRAIGLRADQHERAVAGRPDVAPGALRLVNWLNLVQHAYWPGEVLLRLNQDILRWAQMQSPRLMTQDWSRQIFAQNEMFKVSKLMSDVLEGQRKQIFAALDPSQLLRTSNFINDLNHTASLVDEFARNYSELIARQLHTGFFLGTSAIHEMAGISARLGVTSLTFRLGSLLSESYQSFADRLLTDVAPTFPPSVAIAGMGVAGSILSGSVRPLASLAGFEGEATDVEIEPISPNVFGLLLTEINEASYIDVTGAPERVEQQIALTLSAQIHTAAREVVELRRAINKASQTGVDGEAIFKPTINSEYFSFMLGVEVVTTRSEFEWFARGMFEYIYESSGGWKRITAVIPGFPDIADAIKHLRLYAAHDIEHGDDIPKKGLQVGRHLKRLCGKSVPSNSTEWLTAQLGMLREIADVLRSLLHGLVSTSIN